MTTTESNKAMPFEGLHEECGVFGMYDFDGGDVASSIYYGLFALQHRGQESCGIAVSETSGPKGKVTSYKGMGLVNEVFDGETLEKMRGDIGVGHVRYSTAGESTRENAQPLVLNYVKGTLALAQWKSDQCQGIKKGSGIYRSHFPDNDRLRGHCLSYCQRALAV